MAARIVENLRPLRGLLIPFLVGSLALGIAVVGAVFAGQGADATGGVNRFVEGLSGGSSSILGDIGRLAPLGFSFAAGMVSTVNPCGFAMLPSYLGLYVGSSDKDDGTSHPGALLARAAIVGGVVAGGMVLLFAAAGILIGAGGRFLIDIMPWLGLGIGVILIAAGSWLVAGGKLYIAIPGQVAARVGNPTQVSIRGYFLFGVSYGLASLSCTLPIFLAVVGSALATSGLLAAVGQFAMYGLGMGFVIVLLTFSIALFKGAMVTAMRTALPYIQPLSAGIMVVAGTYIVFYWLTLGRELL